MSIVACPRCRDEVTLPASVSPQARVRCPLCRDEYILSEALAKMPPALIVLDAGPGLDEPKFGESTYAEPEYRVAGDAAAGGMFDASPGAGAATPAERPKLKNTARAKKKGGSAIGQIVQVLLGGVGALVLFHALAWYTPWNVDPLNVGPEVAKYLPIIVPEKFRGAKKSSGTQPAGQALASNQGAGGGIGPTNNSAPQNKPKKNGGGIGGENQNNKIDLGTPDPGMRGSPDVGSTPVIPPEDNSQPKLDVPLDLSTPKDPLELTANPLDPLAALSSEPKPIKPATSITPADPLAADPLATDPLAPTPEPVKPAAKPADPDKPTEFVPPNPPKPLDPNAKPPVNTFEVTKAYAAAIAKRSTFEQAASDDAETRKQKGREMFDAAASLGNVVADVDLTDPDIADQTIQIKEFAVMMSSQLPFVNFFAVERLNATEETPPGIIVGGKVTDFKSAGTLFETTIEVDRGRLGKFPVAIVTSKSPQDEGAKVGDTAVVLGRVIRDPSKLPNYKGESPLVIQAGHTSVIPQ